jgi:hypothetical protein
LNLTKKIFRVENTEFKNQNSETDYLNSLKGKEVMITDIQPTITEPIKFKGTLRDNRGRVLLLENELELNIFKLPSKSMLTITKSISDDNDIINPHLKVNFSPLLKVDNNNNIETTSKGYFSVIRPKVKNENLLKGQVLIIIIRYW